MDNAVVTNITAQRDAVKAGASTANGMADRGRALEDKWFHDRDQELIAKLAPKGADAAVTAPATAEPTPAAGTDKCGCNCGLANNPRSNRLLEEIYFEEQNRKLCKGLDSKK